MCLCRPFAMLRTTLRLPVKTLPQPDETTCGPTCLHAIYSYLGKTELLDTIIDRTHKLENGGGTFAVFLGCDALRNGFHATIYTYNLMVFDPTWFTSGMDIAERLQRQREIKSDSRLRRATEGYLEFLRLGGRLRLTDLSQSLIHGLLRHGLPVLTGLSSTFLYRAPREYGPNDIPDDVRGFPAGHFVVLTGYDREKRTVLVADPYGPAQEYWSNIDRVLCSVLLGIVTHDANLLVIRTRDEPDKAT
ncbi:Peptidase_C39 like family protein [Nitrosospira multiformis]|nr:Peptidase_C39 like family protein [Nitrosospira multiformis]